MLPIKVSRITRTIALTAFSSAALYGCGGGGSDGAPAPSPAAGSLSLSAGTYSVNEGGGSLTVTVSRSSGSDGSVSVALTTTAGSATAGSDYTATSSTLTWASGDSANKAINIPIMNDSSAESDETFTVAISSPTGGATMGSTTTATATIADNDSPPGGNDPPPVTQNLGYYTDLSSAPVTAKVTAYGIGFGGSGNVTLGGTAQTVVSYSDTKVVFTVSGSGGALVVGGKAIGNLPVHTGRVREATTSTLKSTWETVMPGDVIYVRDGNYTGIYGEATWTADAQLDTFRQGSAAQPIALVAMPGETVTFNKPSGHANFVFGDGRGSKARYITIAGFNIIGDGDCVTAGGDTSNDTHPESGGEYIRVVANRIEITDATGNTMTGLLSVQGDGWQILGNTFVDPANRVIINNNHAIYIQNGADNVEVAYNRLVNLHMGHVIQVHQDGSPMDYQNVAIHDNLIESTTDNTDMRGINVGNVADSSTFTIDRNTLRNVGQDFSGIAVYHGVVLIRDNLFYSVRAPNIDVSAQGGGTRRVTASGNRFETVGGHGAVEVDNGASFNEVTLSGNRYCGIAVPSIETNALPCT